MEGAVDFIKKMLRLKSVNLPGDEEPVVRLIESMLEDNGIEVVVKNVGENRSYLV